MLHRRTVGDVMTEEVITLRPNTPFHEIAALDANDIVAAPVIDDEGAPIGVVSASDVLRRETGMPDPQGQDGNDERAGQGPGPDGERAHEQPRLHRPCRLDNPPGRAGTPQAARQTSCRWSATTGSSPASSAAATCWTLSSARR